MVPLEYALKTDLSANAIVSSIIEQEGRRAIGPTSNQPPAVYIYFKPHLFGHGQLIPYIDILCEPVILFVREIAVSIRKGHIPEVIKQVQPQAQPVALHPVDPST